MAMKIWEQLDGETPAPWRAFQAFLALPAPRTLQGLSDATRGTLGPPEGYSYGTLEQWSCEYMWTDRAFEYDKWIQHKKHMGAGAIAVKAGARMARKQLRATGMALEIATKKFQELLTGKGVHEINPHHAARLLREAVILSRLITGEATERIEEKIDLSKLSDDELAALEATVKKAQGS